jgi:hypothetical protein
MSSSSLNRIRHRTLRVSTKDKTSGTTSRASFRLGSVAFPDATSLSLKNISIPHMISNVYNGNCEFVFYLRNTIQTVSGINDQIIIRDTVTNTNYTVNVGTINGTPASYNVDLGSITLAINAVLPSSVIDLSPEPLPPPTESPRLILSLTSGNPIQILKNDGLGLVLGVYTEDTQIVTVGNDVPLPNPTNGYSLKLDSFHYTYDEIIPVFETKLNDKLATLSAGTVTVQKNSTINPSESYDDRIVVTYTPATTEELYIGSIQDGSFLSPVLGYSQDVSTNVDKAPAKVQLFGIKEIYLHCSQVNQQKTQLTDEAKLVSIHATIPVNVGYGGLISYLAPQHTYNIVHLNKGSQQVKFFTITLRDSRGNVLSELDPYEYSASFDLDLKFK